MTPDEAKETLIKHSEFFQLWEMDFEVSRANQSIAAEIKGAMEVLVPGFSKVNCDTCSGEWIREANRHRLAALKEPKFYTFPKKE